MRILLLLGLLLLAAPALAQQQPEVILPPPPPNMAGQPVPRVAPPRIGDQLVGTRWQAATIAGQPVLRGGRPLTVEFLRSDYVRGGAGCNRFVGPWATRADKLVLGPLRKSRLACVGSLGIQEERYIATLDASERVELQEENKVLLLWSVNRERPSRFVRLP